MASDKNELDIKTLLREFSATLPKFPDGRIDYSNSKKALVLTCFVKYQDKILLLRRSDKVGTYKRKWNSVAGYIDKMVSVQEKAFEELQEELGLSKDIIENIKIGEAYEIDDKEINRIWITIPCLATLREKPEIKLDWEHTEYRWIKPEEIASFDIVPNTDKSCENILKNNHNFMQTKEIQAQCTDLVKELDKKFNINRDPQLSFTQFMEEVGELAKDINLPRLRNKEADIGNLHGEFADVFIQLCILANLHNIDLEQAVEEKISIIKERHGL